MDGIQCARYERGASQYLAEGVSVQQADVPSPSTGVPGLGTEGGWRCSVRGKHRSDPFLERPKESRARALPRPGSLADREAKEGSPALTSARGFWPSGLERRSAGWLGRGRTALRPIRGSQAQPKEKPRWLGRLAAFGLQGPRRGSFGGLVAWCGGGWFGLRASFGWSPREVAAWLGPYGWRGVASAL